MEMRDWRNEAKQKAAENCEKVVEEGGREREGEKILCEGSRGVK